MNQGIAVMLGGTVAGGIIALSMNFIEPHEGRRHTTYVDPVGVPTVCVGHTLAAIPGKTYSDEECDLLLLADTIPLVIGIGKLAERPLSDEQWVACTSLAFNIGLTAFRKSTLLRRINEGDEAGAAAEFERWRLAGGKVLPGLVVRRAREARLFEGQAPA